MNRLPSVKIKPFLHREKEVVQVLFERNEELTKLLRSGGRLQWSKTMNCWYLPYSGNVVSNLFSLLKGKAYLNYDEFKLKVEQPKEATSEKIDVPKKLAVLLPEVEQKIEDLKLWMRSKRYSENTINTYTEALRLFLRYFSGKPLSEIGNEDIVEFNNAYILKNKLSASFQNQLVNAVKLFFKVIESSKLDPELVHRPKRAHVLPNVLSKEEVKAVLNALGNIKHKAMLSLIYSCGLRCGELLRLKPEHIDSKRKLVVIKFGKGMKDRVVPLSERILDLLREYWKVHSPKEFLFEGQKAGEMYDSRSLQQVLKNSVLKAGIKKPVTLHWLRHSYATHLLENGTDLRYIQEMLGHNSSRTTEIYTHVSNKSIQQITSPFDYL